VNRRAPYAGPDTPARWQVSETYRHGSREIRAGDEIRIRGARGTYRFWRHVVNPPQGRRRRAIEWIDVTGGPPGVREFRAFRPDRISKVLRPRKTVDRIRTSH